MKHNLKISVSKEPEQAESLLVVMSPLGERILRFLLGDKRRVTILIPGDSVEELSICETTKGGNDLEQSKVTA